MDSQTADVFFWIGTAIVFLIGLVLVAINCGTQKFSAYVTAARDEEPPPDVQSPLRGTRVVLALGTKIGARLTKG